MADEAGRAFCEHLDLAWQVALSSARDPVEAEDAVQDAYLRFCAGWGSFDRSRPVRPYLARAVVRAVLDRARAERRRAARERARPAEPAVTDGDSTHARERSAALRAALLALPDDVRVAVSLRYLHSLSLEETAEALSLARSTASDRVRRGLEELRKVLAAAGFGALALPGAIGALPQPAAPAGLAAAVGRLAAGGKAAGKTGGALAAAKGGFMTKLIAGALLAGAVAAGVAAVSGARGELPAERPRFAVPVWHPDARWQSKPEAFIGSGARGFLGGPAPEVMWYGNGLSPGRGAYGSGCGPYGCTSYDPAAERFHLVAGASRGCMDGPFSRARFGGHDYSHRSRGARSPDGRYVFLTEPYFGQCLRRLDMVEQQVRTIPLDVKGIGGMTADSQGRLYVLVAWTDRLLVKDAEGKTEKEVKLDMQEKVGGGTFPCILTLDEKRGRLYGSGYGAKKWYVWHWDLKDGSFHGVLARPQKDETGKRKRNECGPFAGTDLYGEMGNFFGPDDPERRFLYVTPNDTLTFFRLDLEKKEIWGCSKSREEVRFIGSGVPGNLNWGTRMTGGGDIVTVVPHWNGPQLLRFPRVK